MMNSNEIFKYKAETVSELLDHPDYSHTRLHRAWYPEKGDLDSVTVYFRCSDSPSGVLSAGGFSLTPENQELLRQRNIRANLGPSRGAIASANPPLTKSF